jgi:hypothetical protein
MEQNLWPLLHGQIYSYEADSHLAKELPAF